MWGGRGGERISPSAEWGYEDDALGLVICADSVRFACHVSIGRGTGLGEEL